MTFAPQTAEDLLRHGFDSLIDVHSPSEFVEDHVLGPDAELVWQSRCAMADALLP